MLSLSPPPVLNFAADSSSRPWLDGLRFRGGTASPWTVLAGVLLAGTLVGVVVAALPPFAGLAALVGVGVGVLLLFSDRAAFVCVCGIITLLPFGVIPVKLGASLTFLDAVLAVMALIWLLRLLQPASSGSRPIQQEMTAGGPFAAITIVVMLWLGASLLSFLVGSGLTAPPADTVRYYATVVLATFFFVVTIKVPRDETTLRVTVVALVVGGATAAAMGIVLYFLPHHLATQILSSLRVVGYPSGADVLRFRVDFNQAERAISTSVDPNILGGLLVVTTSLGLSQLLARQPIVPRIIAAPACLAMLGCLLLTYSRGSWIALGVAVIVMATWQYRRLLVLVAIALVILVQLPISHSFTTELQSGVQVQDKAAGMRLGEIKDSFRLIGRYPVFGVGFGAAPDSDLYVGVSNIYLLVGEETGIVGLALFLTAIGLYMVTMLTGLARVRDPALMALAVGLFGASVGTLAAGMFDRYFFSYPHDVALFWLCLALGLVTLDIDRRRSSDASGGGVTPSRSKSVSTAA